MQKISASILNSNLTLLGESIKAAEKGGADFIHVDIMDGVYVDNFTFGPKTVSDIKKITDLPLEVHLETFNPHRFVDMFADAGADIIVAQLECLVNPIRTLESILRRGLKAGIAVSPGSGIEDLEYLLERVDLLVMMSVEPGFGGQKFERLILEKIRRTKKMLDRLGSRALIEADGGVNFETGRELIESGADILAVGSFVFESGDIQKSIEEFKKL